MIIHVTPLSGCGHLLKEGFDCEILAIVLIHNFSTRDEEFCSVSHVFKDYMHRVADLL